MTPLTLTIYLTGLGAALLIVLLALVQGWWIPALIGAICGGLFAVAGRFVLGRGWRPPPPVRTRRPVYRRRR